jgi:N-acetylmuramoyl-L-alanine amidase
MKIAYGAGHIYTTAGKRLPKSLDPNQTREWVLNDRVADAFAEAAQQYEDVELLRVDDPQGKKNIPLSTRCRKANDWGADVCIAFHHDAAGKIFTGGGVTAHWAKAADQKYAAAVYNTVIEAGGIRGDRANPVPEGNLYVPKNCKAPTVLLECGFMNSTVDSKIILDPAYSKLVGYAAMEAIARVNGLKKKAPDKSAASDQMYRVRRSWADAASQKGAFRVLDYAIESCPEGYTVYDKDGKAVYTNAPNPSRPDATVKVDGAKSFSKSQAGIYKVKSNIGLKLRTGASTKKTILETMPDGSVFTCYGYYTGSWLYGVSASGKLGYCHKSYLVKK